MSLLYNKQPEKREIIVQRDGGIKEIADTLRSSNALHFLLIHPLGHDGWHVQLKQVIPHILDDTGNPRKIYGRLTTRAFYHIHQRDISTNSL